MDDSRLDDLLDQYQEILDAGRVPNLADLCRDCPDLRDELGRRVVRLHKLGALLGDVPGGPSVPPPEHEPLSLSDDKTWVSGQVPGAEPTIVEIPAPPGYEIVEPLGEGGMGVVYKARQVGLNRLVALKVILRGARARAIDLSRFRDEAQSIAALKHPNIVQIYEVGEYRGQPFFSLEYCAGGTLAAALNGQPQAPESAALMAEVLARAFQSAHERGIIHRDLKPSNVLLAIEGEDRGGGLSTMVGEAPADAWRHLALRNPQAAFKVTDFGLAKRVDDDSGRTIDGSVVGTPSYMAPEQARGDTKVIGTCSDVWALGAVLYELITGRPPFRGSTVVDTLDQVRTRDAVPVRQLQPKVPKDLETICLKCLEKDPAKRYLSAQALADDLRRFLDHKPILARPVGQLTRAARWCRREPRTAGLVAAVVLLAAVVPALLVGHGLRLARAEERIEAQRKATEVAQRAESAAQEAAETQRYYAAINAAARLRAQPRPGWRHEAIARALDAATARTPVREPLTVRTELAAALGAIDLRRLDGVAPEQAAGALAYDPDGLLAVAPQLVQPVPVKFVSLVDRAGKTVQKLTFRGTPTLKYRGIDRTTALAFSPDGRWLFLGLRSGTVVRWDLKAGPDRASWDAHDWDVIGFAFTPDSKWVYTAGHDGQVKRWPINGDRKKPDAVWPKAPADPTGKHRTGLAFWDGPRPAVLAFGPGGASMLDPDTLKELKPAAGAAGPTIHGSSGPVVAHPASGTLVVQRGEDADVMYWEGGICQSVGMLRDPMLETGCSHADTIDDLALHPSGLLLATVCPKEGLAKLWDLTSAELVAAVPAPDGRGVAFSPDGRTLAVGGDHETARYEVSGLVEQTYRGRRGLPVKAIGRTADGDLATIAAIEHPETAGHLRTVVSVWKSDGTLLETVLHRADGPQVTGHFRIACSPQAKRTVFHVGDGALTWWNPGRKPELAGTDLRRTSFFDLSLDPAGRAWSLEGGDRLGLRAAGTGGTAEMVPAGGTPGGGRKDLSCVRAGAGLVVVGGDNGFLRVVPADGKRVLECPCFDTTPATWMSERANTVRAVDVRDDNSQAAAGTEDGRLWLVGLPGATVAASHAAHVGRVTTVSYAPGGEWLASGGRDREVRLWKQTAGRYEPYLTLPAGRSVRQVLFSADGAELLVLREGDTAVRVWRLTELHKRFREAGLDQ